MPTEKKLTGYPSIDRPQERYYRQAPIREIEVNQTIYEMVFGVNKDNMFAPALEYMRTAWSFEKLKTETDKAADAFAKSGLKMGDTVLLGVSNCPEAVAILLALNKLGVVSKWFDVRAGVKDIEGYANDSNCRYIIIFYMYKNPHTGPNSVKLVIVCSRPFGIYPLHQWCLHYTLLRS